MRLRVSMAYGWNALQLNVRILELLGPIAFLQVFCSSIG